MQSKDFNQEMDNDVVTFHYENNEVTFIPVENNANNKRKMRACCYIANGPEGYCYHITSEEGEDLYKSSSFVNTEQLYDGLHMHIDKLNETRKKENVKLVGTFVEGVVNCFSKFHNEFAV